MSSLILPLLHQLLDQRVLVLDFARLDTLNLDGHLFLLGLLFFNLFIVFRVNFVNDFLIAAVCVQQLNLVFFFHEFIVLAVLIVYFHL